MPTFCGHNEDMHVVFLVELNIFLTELVLNLVIVWQLLHYWFKHILFRKNSMYNIYCDNINTLGYERKQNAYIVLLLYI